jgi:hypothetical protein
LGAGGVGSHEKRRQRDKKTRDPVGRGGFHGVEGTVESQDRPASPQ